MSRTGHPGRALVRPSLWTRNHAPPGGRLRTDRPRRHRLSPVEPSESRGPAQLGVGRSRRWTSSQVLPPDRRRTPPRNRDVALLAELFRPPRRPAGPGPKVNSKGGQLNAYDHSPTNKNRRLSRRVPHSSALSAPRTNAGHRRRDPQPPSRHRRSHPPHDRSQPQRRPEPSRSTLDARRQLHYRQHARARAEPPHALDHPPRNFPVGHAQREGLPGLLRLHHWLRLRSLILPRRAGQAVQPQSRPLAGRTEHLFPGPRYDRRNAPRSRAARLEVDPDRSRSRWRHNHADNSFRPVVYPTLSPGPAHQEIGTICSMHESEQAGAIAGIQKDARQPETAVPRAVPDKSWRDSKWLAAVEFLLVALIFYADYRRLIPFSKTPELLLLGWISLRVRKLRWRDVGLTRYRSWPVTIALGAVMGTALEAFQLLITQPILSRLIGKEPDLELFRMLTGNLKMTLLFIALAWTLAAFGEELFWRGYLLNRVADIFGRKQAAWIVNLLIVSIAFGLAHGYQGLTGWIEEGLAGLALGLMYLRTGRNLSVPIIAHGVSDTIDMVLIFFGKMPGM